MTHFILIVKKKNSLFPKASQFSKYVIFPFENLGKNGVKNLYFSL